jgi:TolB-like protein
MDIMKRKMVVFWGICCMACMAIFSCATTGGNETGTTTLDEAIRASAEQLGADLTGRKVAVVAFGSGSEALSDYVIDELSRSLVNSRAVTVVDRKDLDKVRAELQFNLSGEVSDESAQSIGKMLGAQSVITGTLTDLGSAYRFGVKAINVESAALESMPGFDVGKRDGRVAHLAGQRNAAVPAASPQAAVQPQTEQRVLPKDLAEVFGTKGVTATFNAVHAFLQTCNSGSAAGRRERISQGIMLGDWIDLPHLTVQGDAGGGAINTDNVDLGGNGKLLRLIVVGIDSFVKTNKDAPAHVVFQFQNIPGTHRMNDWDGNYGGYKASEMRRYLTGNFIQGLVAAGVPEGVLYAPIRYIANAGRSANTADALADWLWLPTMWELFGFDYFTNETWETKTNQQVASLKK